MKPKTFYENFVEQCEKRHISKNRALTEAGLSAPNMNAWKKGAGPNATTLKILADYFQITMDELWGCGTY